jgi:hypothetical protein
LFLGTDSEGDLLFDYNIPIPNQVLFAETSDDIERTAATGTITYAPVCTWVSVAEVMTYLGITIANPSDDYTLLTQSVSAGNQFCYRRRQESGYTDSLTTSPGGDATLGTLMYCAALWRSRGSIENTYATFDGMGTASQQSLRRPKFYNYGWQRQRDTARVSDQGYWVRPGRVADLAFHPWHRRKRARLTDHCYGWPSVKP